MNEIVFILSVPRWIILTIRHLFMGVNNLCHLDQVLRTYINTDLLQRGHHSVYLKLVHLRELSWVNRHSITQNCKQRNQPIKIFTKLGSKLLQVLIGFEKGTESIGV